MNPRILLILTIGVLCYALADVTSDVGYAAQVAITADAAPPTQTTEGTSLTKARTAKSSKSIASDTSATDGQRIAVSDGMTGGGAQSRGGLACLCGLDTEGQDFCFQDEFCTAVRACQSSADCGTGERCLADNCCSAPLNFACFAVCNEGCSGGGVCGSYNACATPPPPNDECIFAQDAAVPSQVVASTVGATFDSAPFCDTDDTAPGVWYRVIGTGNTIRASMCTEFVDYDPKISVYCGGCDVLTCVAGNDDGFCPGLPQFPSDVSWCSIAGEEYLVLVHGYQSQTGGAILNFSDDEDPTCTGRVSCVSGDDCGDATVIPSVPYSTNFDNSTALPGGFPGTCNSSLATDMDNDVWFTYTPRVDCVLTIAVDPDIVMPGYDGITAVYAGPDCQNLTELTCLDEPEPMITNVSVLAGTTYWIQIGDWGTAPGGGLTQLAVDCRTPSACCINGDCVDGLPQTLCQEQGGAWFAGVSCANFVCPEACCVPDGRCVDAPPEACAAEGGVPRGPGTNCLGDQTGDGVDDACQDAPCDHCGAFPHWVDQCGPGIDSMPSGALVGIDLGPNLDCVADRNFVLRGPVHIRRSGPMDDSAVYPGTRPVDTHQDVIDTEMVQLMLSGGGVLMRAGAAQDVAGQLPPTFGTIAEQTDTPLLADSFFEVFAAVEFPGLPTLYNHDPLKVTSKIDCIPPDTTYFHPVGCIPLYDGPPGTDSVIVANLVTANHSTYPTCGDPGTGDCHEPHDVPFCSNAECCNKVCELEQTCCTEAWTDLCVNIAAEACAQACCLPDGTCRDSTPTECATAGGTLAGPGTSCDVVFCTPQECGQSSFPVCGGVCPEGQQCVGSVTGGACVCEPIPCEQSQAPACGGACPTGQQCVSSLTSAACVCEPIPCDQSPFPTCGGACPSGSQCIGSDLVGACVCAPLPCDQTSPACDGACPDGSHCETVGGVILTSPLLPPESDPIDCNRILSMYAGDGGIAQFANGVSFSDPMPRCFTSVLRENDGNGNEVATFDALVGGMVDDGTGPQSILLSGQMKVLVMAKGTDTTGTWDTEIVSLSLTGDVGGMPLLIRESPTMPSTGQTMVTSLGDGRFQIDSFFDVWTEVSIDGGDTFHPQTNGAVHLALQPVQPPSCQCVPDVIPCGQSPFPECGGECPAGSVCTASTLDNFCECISDSIMACCDPVEGLCRDIPRSQCLELGGIPKGEGTACETDLNGNGVDDACEDDPCEDCGPGDHWVDGCAAGVDSMPSGALIGLDLGPDFDCIPDTNLVLRGPVHIGRSDPRDDSVNFPGISPVDGHPTGPGLDVIDTEMLSLNLTGGGVTLIAGAGRGMGAPLPPSLGAIAEQPGTPPLADSFFDVFFEVNLGSGVFAYNHRPLRVNSKIDCLPPDATYIHPIGCLPLYDAPPGAGGTVIAQLVTANHSTYPSCGDPATGDCFEPHDTPFCRDETCCNRVCSRNVLPECCTGPWTEQCASAALEICGHNAIEVDTFDLSVGRFELQHPDGNIEQIPVSGPATVQVFFEGPNEGDANDDDGDGLDEVRSEMVDLSLDGYSPKLGPVHITVNPVRPSLGLIKELVNNNPGLLDVDPFAPGEADSFFDVFFQVEIGGVRYFTVAPKRMRSRIDHKPPGAAAVYQNVDRVQLFDENGNATGYFIGATRHRPRPVVEVDQFDQSIGQFDLKFPDGSIKTIPVSGPATVNVFFDGPTEGDANDSDGNGRDDVATEMVALNLVGHHPDLGVVQVLVHPTIPSLGQIEELVNNNPGTLDVDPFAPGAADSFFDVFFEIHVGGVRYFTHRPKRMRSRIEHKPPGPTAVYVSPNDVELFDEAGNQTGIFLSGARHRPHPIIEVDQFDFSIGRFDLRMPDGSVKTIPVSGPATVNVYFDGPHEGDADDSNGNGLEDVQTEMVALNLTGFHPDLGLVQVNVHPVIPSLGQIEERANNTAGTLDVAPFTAGGVADSFFDIFFEIQVGGARYFTQQPKRMRSRIDHKPPGPGAVYEGLQEIELFDAAGNATGIFITAARHRPNPVVEVDTFDLSIGSFALIDPDGASHPVGVGGTATAHVLFEGPVEGRADDDDGNGLDEVQTELVALNLTGDSPLGPVQVHLLPVVPSIGMIEEKANNTPGVLDVPPFTDTGMASSFFDIFFEIDVNGIRYFTQTAKHMQSQIDHKPPSPESVYEDPQVIPLVDENGQPTGFALGVTRHIPNPLIGTDPPVCAIDARQPHPVNSLTPKQGWDRLVLRFAADPTALNLQPSDFAVEVDPPGTVAPLVVTNVILAPANTVIVELNRPIDPGHWACVVYLPSGRRWCVGFLPADSDQNLLSNTGDILALINSINNVPGRVLPPYATDIDRSGLTAPQDILRLIDLLNGAGTFDMWITRRLPPCPQ